MTTAEVVTHEIGHNLNMLHDFDDFHAGKGCDGTGFMSYGTHPYEWSTCSVADLTAQFNSLIASSNSTYLFCVTNKESRGEFKGSPDNR